MKSVQFILFAVLLGLAGLAGLAQAGQAAAHQEHASLIGKLDVPLLDVLSGRGESHAAGSVVAPCKTCRPDLSHVPEPKGWTLYLLGCGFLVYQLRRRRKKQDAWDLNKKY